MKKILLFIITSFLVNGFANATNSVIAKVTGVGVYGNGAVYVFFDRAISSCTTASRMDLPTHHPAKKYVQSIAMTAFATRKSVKVHPSSCDGNTPKFDSSDESYFYLTNDNP